MLLLHPPLLRKLSNKISPSAACRWLTRGRFYQSKPSDRMLGHVILCIYIYIVHDDVIINNSLTTEPILIRPPSLSPPECHFNVNH